MVFGRNTEKRCGTEFKRDSETGAGIRAVLQNQSRYRDIKKRLKNGTSFAVVAVENQSTIDYTMPLRIMQYDWMEYDRQIREMESRRQQKLMGKGRKYSKYETCLGKGEKICPVYTICLYHGTKEWDGPKRLEDMIDFGGDERLRKSLFHDYGMTLVCVDDLKTLSVFRTDLRLLLEALTVRGDRAAMEELFRREEFACVSYETARTIAIMTDSTEILERLDKEEGGVNMCKAVDDMRKHWEGKGIEKGIEVLILDNLETGVSEDAIIEKLIRRFGLDAGDAKAYFDKYNPG